PQRWRARAVGLAETDLRVLWADGTAGRALAGDGRIYSLPSRLQVSEPLPGGRQLLEARRLCGEPIALTTDGLYRLRHSTDGGFATWEPDDLARLLPGADVELALNPGRLDLIGNELFLSTTHGGIAELRAPMSCP